MTEDLLVTNDEGVLIVTLNRPDQLNALTHRLMRSLAKLWEDAHAPEVRAVVLTGAGRGFCAGADLKQGVAVEEEPRGLRANWHPEVLGMATLPKPVVAAVNGVAAGAGVALAAAADVRIASSEARFVAAHATIGLAPDGGGSFFVPRLIGAGRAFEFYLGGEAIDAGRALEWGLVNEVVAPGDLLDRAVQRAYQLGSHPGRAVGLTKLLLLESASSTLAAQLERETELQRQAIDAPERAAARAAVVEGLGRP